jgi:branched-chain amino acid transport system permease protein
VRSWAFLIVWGLVGAVLFALLRLLQFEYLFFAGYVVLQFVVLATAWNILGGYCGYVNFGSAAFFALGAYSTVTLHRFAAQLDRLLPEQLASLFKLVMPLPIPALVLIGGAVAGLVGLGTGYLTLRLRGAFFAIATLALAVVLQTLIINWSFVGGARGAYIIPPNTFPVLGTYIQYLFLIMLALAVVALTVARGIERSRLGYGFATIRDDELAAEASGVPTLRLKLIATTLSGALMGMAGAPFPYYIGYLEPSSAFGLAYAVNSIAMPMIGGTGSWIGPLVGAILLGTIQQVATVTISSAVNLLIVGVLLVAFVVIAPNGIVGLIQDFLRAAASRSRIVQMGVVLIAIYCFVLGLLEILISIPWMAFGITGIVTFALGIMLLACAYALLTLQYWSPVLTAASLAITVIGAIFLYLTHMFAIGNERLLAGSIAIAGISIWFVLRSDVRSIYSKSIDIPMPSVPRTEP